MLRQISLCCAKANIELKGGFAAVKNLARDLAANNPFNNTTLEGFDKTAPGAVSYTHLTLPTNREV